MRLSCLIISDSRDEMQKIRSAIVRYCTPDITLTEQLIDCPEAHKLECHPHIVVLYLSKAFGIVMQYMDRLRSFYPEAYFAVYVQFKEFTFSQTAVNLERVEFLPVPFQANVLQEAITDAVNQIHQINESLMATGRLEAVVNDNVPVIRQHYLSMLLRLGVSDPETVRQKFSVLHIDCPGPYYTVVVADMPEERQKANYEAVSFLVLGSMRSMLKTEGYQVYIFFDSGYRINCLIGHRNKSPDSSIREVLDRLGDYCILYMGVKVYCGIGDAVKGPGSIHDSYLRAEKDLKEAFWRQADGTDKALRKAVGYMEEHLSDPKLDLAEVSAFLGFSRSYFSRVFKQIRGENFAVSLQKMRIAQAKILLETTRLPVGEIAARTGFVSPKYFTAVFGKTEGITPSRYRRLSASGTKYQIID